MAEAGHRASVTILNLAAIAGATVTVHLVSVVARLLADAQVIAADTFTDALRGEGTATANKARFHDT